MALRLIAHAQANGGFVGPELQLAVPPALPRFHSAFGRSLGGPKAAEGGGNGGALAEMSARDKRKYASIFRKTDTNRDGVVEGEPDLRVLMERSKLPNAFLALIWEFLDRDNQGRMRFPEFVVAMHLITRCKKGDFPLDRVRTLRDLEAVLSPQLAGILEGGPLESVEELRGFGGALWGFLFILLRRENYRQRMGRFSPSHERLRR